MDMEMSVSSGMTKSSPDSRRDRTPPPRCVSGGAATGRQNAPPIEPGGIAFD